MITRCPEMIFNPSYTGNNIYIYMFITILGLLLFPTFSTQKVTLTRTSNTLDPVANESARSLLLIFLSGITVLCSLRRRCVLGSRQPNIKGFRTSPDYDFTTKKKTAKAQHSSPMFWCWPQEIGILTLKQTRKTHIFCLVWMPLYGECTKTF